MKSYYKAFLLLIILSSCAEPTKTPNSQSQIDSLNALVNSLQSELTSSQTKIDSLTQNNQTKEIIDSLEYVLKRKDVNFSALTQLQVGEFQRLKKEDENGTWAFEYRIEVYGSEIYKSVYLTKIEYFGESQRRVGNTYEIDIENELGLFGESTNSLGFVKWTSAMEFQLATSDSEYDMVIHGPKNVKAKTKN